MRYEGIESVVSFKPTLPDCDRLVARFDAVIGSMPLLMLVCCAWSFSLDPAPASCPNNTCCREILQIW